MNIPDQWRYLEELAIAARREGKDDQADKLLACASTIYDLWKNSLKEIKLTLVREENTKVVGLRNVMLEDED